MFKKSLSIIIIFILCTTLLSITVASTPEQYQLKCAYLKNPDLIIKVADQTAKFWEKAYDKQKGGFYTYVNRDGSIDMSKPYKVTIIQERDAYAFAKAYQLTGKKEYLDYARKGLDFMYKNAWDKVNTGWNLDMNRDGSLTSDAFEGMDWNSVKWFQGDLQGVNAMLEVTRSKTDETWQSKAYSSIEKNLWDSRPGNEGYFFFAGKDWSNPNTKSPYSTLEAIGAYTMQMYLLNLDSNYKKRIETLGDSFINHVIGSMDNRKFGFDDQYDADWKAIKSQSSTTSGNFLKAALSLYEAYLVEPKPEYKAGAEKLINQILYSNAYDNVNGGAFDTLDPNTGNPTDKRKCWWVLEAGVNSGLNGYYISKNSDYLKMADESMNFFMKYMYDSKYGDSYGGTDANGSNPDTAKGTYWKDAFHPMELFYNTYLYGNLMIQNKPVTLYYYFDADKKARDIPVNPITLGCNKLTISSVTLNGKAYKDFDGEKCILKLPANTKGDFKVTFKPVITSK